MPAKKRPSSAITAALAAVLSLGLSGCAAGLFGHDEPGTPPATLSPSPIGPPSSVGPAPAADLASFYRQKAAWKSCRGDKLCATIEVPLDYAHPAARSISLAVLKVPAGDAGRRVGSLVVNPGGPGGSGVDFAANTATYFGPELQRAFDIVGFDPRGVGESTPLHCLPDNRLDTFVASDPDPDDAQEIAHSDALLKELGDGCVRESGALAAHMSTEEAAKDMDILRAVLGDAKLSYFGASYGTFLGATYADLFPQRVGRMVLDGAIDPSLSTLKLNLVQARGFETALRAYVGHCVESAGCFLGPDVDAGTARIRTFLDDVEAHPIQGAGARRLTVGNAVLGIWAPLYNKSYWGLLDTSLKAAFAGNGAPLLSLSDAYTSRGPGGYTNNSLEALYAVNCLDHDDSVPSSKVPSFVPEFEKASPTFGAIFAFGLSSCSKWPVHTGRVPAPIHARGAAPIVVIGTTRDPATPLAWARALARQLDSGVLVRRDGDGHTGYHAGNQCVDRVVESYLVSGDTPKNEVDC